jgi:hypothetical protein
MRQHVTPAAGIDVTSCASIARSRTASAHVSATTTPIARRCPILLVQRAAGRGERAAEGGIADASLDAELRGNVGRLAAKEGWHKADAVALASEQLHHHG